MSITTLAFFNNKGGVGKTTLVYHLAWMFADLGKRIVAVDLDPQANLTASFLDEDRLEDLWTKSNNFTTIHQSMQPIIRGVGDVITPSLEIFEFHLALVVGDLSLSDFEDDLSSVWPRCLDRDERAFRVTSAFWRVVQEAGKTHDADLILLDLGPNLGAINRAALLASDFVVVPLAPDLYSLQGLHNLGPKLRAWRNGWQERLLKNPIPEVPMPRGSMDPVGYVVMQHSVRFDRPVRAYDRWMSRIPLAFHQDVLGNTDEFPQSFADDPYCLARLKHYRSLMAMSMESRKPMFRLRAADGAIGSHFTAAQQTGSDFRALAERLEMEISGRMAGNV